MCTLHDVYSFTPPKRRKVHWPGMVRKTAVQWNSWRNSYKTHYYNRTWWRMTRHHHHHHHHRQGSQILLDIQRPTACHLGCSVAAATVVPWVSTDINLLKAVNTSSVSTPLHQVDSTGSIQTLDARQMLFWSTVTSLQMRLASILTQQRYYCYFSLITYTNSVCMPYYYTGMALAWNNDYLETKRYALIFLHITGRISMDSSTWLARLIWCTTTLVLQNHRPPGIINTSL